MGHCQSSIQNKVEDKKSMLSIFEDKIIFWYINMSGEGADLNNGQIHSLALPICDIYMTAVSVVCLNNTDNLCSSLSLYQFMILSSAHSW